MEWGRNGDLGDKGRAACIGCLLPRPLGSLQGSGIGLEWRVVSEDSLSGW